MYVDVIIVVLLSTCLASIPSLHRTGEQIAGGGPECVVVAVPSISRSVMRTKVKSCPRRPFISINNKEPL